MAPRAMSHSGKPLAMAAAATAHATTAAIRTAPGGTACHRSALGTPAPSPRAVRPRRSFDPGPQPPVGWDLRLGLLQERRPCSAGGPPLGPSLPQPSEPPPPATHDDEHGADEGEEQRRQLPDDGPVPWMCPCSLKGSASTVEPPELTFGAASCRSRRESSRRFSGI